jgi:hypothetical protein
MTALSIANNSPQDRIHQLERCFILGTKCPTARSRVIKLTHTIVKLESIFALCAAGTLYPARSALIRSQFASRSVLRCSSWGQCPLGYEIALGSQGSQYDRLTGQLSQQLLWRWTLGIIYKRHKHIHRMGVLGRSKQNI